MELYYKIDLEVSKKHKRLISFSDYDVEKDINNASVLSACVELEKKIREHCESHDNWNEEQIQRDLKRYNKVFVELFEKFLLAVDIPSVMIVGAGNYPVAKSQKQLDRQHEIGRELFHETGRIAILKEKILRKYNYDLINMHKKQAEKSKEFGEFETIINKKGLLSYGNDTENARIYLKFDGKPSVETITALKKNAFKWSPSKKRWQRQTTANGVNGLKKVLATYEIEFNSYLINDI